MSSLTKLEIKEEQVLPGSGGGKRNDPNNVCTCE
jgi:hypothetical protein